MILTFSQKFPNGEPTYFAEKIIANYLELWTINQLETFYGNDNYQAWMQKNSYNLKNIDNFDPKLHTIRDDSKNRWKAGSKIHPGYNNRSKDQFQFAPTLECRLTQIIEFDWSTFPNFYRPIILIDNAHFYNEIAGIDKGLNQLAINDGFHSIEQFLNWFDKDFTGKIIHWTDLRY